MTSPDNAQQPEPHRKEPEKGKFYAMRSNYNDYMHDLEIANEEDLIWDDDLVMFPPGHRPDCPYPTTPQLRFKAGSKKRKLPQDFDFTAGLWLISERLKKVFEEVDPEGFVFVACDFQLTDGSQGPQYYLCDVIRTLDALDEEASKVKIIVSDEYEKGKHYSFVGLPKIAFKESVVGSAHVFRTPYSSKEFCDRVLRDAIAAVGKTPEDRIRGLALADAADL